MNTVSMQPIPAKIMHTSIPDDMKKRFHAACAITGLLMSQVMASMIEQWLKANEAPIPGESVGQETARF